jgi:crotonobetainyl-CoA:carnitine CoA-transferase CaiB-like acyl-CoA transferase
MPGPLAGMRVIDLTHVMAGPVCTLFLADVGAEVIKVERAPDGDDCRRMAPPFVGHEAAGYAPNSAAGRRRSAPGRYASRATSPA